MPADFPTVGQIPFINRGLTIAEFKDYIAGYDFGPIKPTMLVLHHTESPTESTWRGLATMQFLQKFYRDKKWTAGPHFFVGPDKIWLATPMSEVGIHANAGNGSVQQGWYSLGLEMVGNYNNKRPSGAIWEMSKAIMGEVSRKLGIPPRKLITFHRRYNPKKSCPGWAVTEDWVFGEVEAYLNNAAPPPPPPQGAIGTPTPSDELLIESLLEETYKARSGAQGYSNEWAFHQYAVEHNLGAPMGQSARLASGGKEYNYQVFARDTLYCEIPNWGDVQTMSALLGGSIPPAGLGFDLLNATYQTGGATFHADWSFHQYALMRKLGPPVGEGGQINIGGTTYAYQAFAADTLYNVVPNWSDVKQLSQLAAASTAPTVQLREALLGETYKRAGTVYHGDWAFHQLARNFAIGAPLGNSYQIKLEATTYALQVYALDTLYNVVPKWSDVKRLSALAALQPDGVLGGAGDVVFGSSPDTGTVDGSWEPPVAEPFTIVRYSPQARAYSDRANSDVSLVVLHGVPGVAADVLAKFAAPGSRFSPHYFVDSDGTIFQLIDEQYAAWHAGFATLDKVWFNINRSSVGIALERPPLWPEEIAAYPDAQIFALRWLLQQLDRRYQLAPDAVVLWSSLAGSDRQTLDGLPLESITEVLAYR
jgi:hypothetical protein